MKTILLTQNKVAMIDDADFEWLNCWKWHAARSWGIWYARRNQKGKTIYMHRQILGFPQQIDHLNGNGLDNQRKNLRICTDAKNQHNQRKMRGLSQYKGVCWHKVGQKWQAQIRISKTKEAYLGLFNNEIDAAKAYDQKAKEVYGEFARTNF